MAQSIVDICNNALTEVPAGPIASLEERSTEAVRCRSAYPAARDLLLSDAQHAWSWASVRVVLAQTVNDRAEWAYAYALPGRIVPRRIVLPVPVRSEPVTWSIADAGRHVLSEDGEIKYLVAGDTIYTSVESAILEGTDLDVSEARFSAHFQRALEYEIASRVCLPLTKDERRKMALEAHASAALIRARASDAIVRARPISYARGTPVHLAQRDDAGLVSRCE